MNSRLSATSYQGQINLVRLEKHAGVRATADATSSNCTNPAARVLRRGFGTSLPGNSVESLFHRTRLESSLQARGHPAWSCHSRWTVSPGRRRTNALCEHHCGGGKDLNHGRHKRHHHQSQIRRGSNPCSAGSRPDSAMNWRGRRLRHRVDGLWSANRPPGSLSQVTINRAMREQLCRSH